MDKLAVYLKPGFLALNIKLGVHTSYLGLGSRYEVFG